MAAPDLSVVIPVYDEELVLERTFAALVPFLEGLDPAATGVRSFEVVCVDDGSTDRSAEILARAAAADARIRADGLPRNQGKGAAVRKGCLLAEGRFVLFMDADLSTPLEEIPSFLAALDSGYDVVIGNRRAPGSRITRRQPLLRETLGKGFTFMAQLLLAPGVHDFTCGFKGYRREAARGIFERSTLNGWAFDAELIVIAQQRGYRLVQLPVHWRHEDDTKVRLGRAVLGSLRELAVIYWNKRRGRYR